MKIRYRQSLASCESGATLILVALVFVVLLAVLGVVIDSARVYTVQSKAQNAADAALLGAVATIDTNEDDLQTSMQQLFNANYPAGYMNSSIVNFTVVQDAASTEESRIYNTTIDITVPTVIMQAVAQLLGGSVSPTNVHIISQVKRGQPTLELALVLDNTGSMNDMAGSSRKIDGLKVASRDLVNILFGPAATLPNLHISIVPYDLAVRIGTGHDAWIQDAWKARYVANGGLVSNRDNDTPSFPTRRYPDVTNITPTAADATRFRTPTDAVGPYVTNGCIPQIDREYSNLKAMRFAMNNKAEALTMIDTMAIAGCTRINVGLMWGWFTLSPSWQGLWDAGKPTLPRPSGPDVTKAIVLMTDGLNTVYKGNSGASNDDTKTAQLCANIKAQGITIYSIGFGNGGSVNQTLLRNCASLPTYYFLAPTSAQLQTAFRQIADDLLFKSLRLTN